MTVYAPSDVTSITVPGGCGQPHAAAKLGPGERFAVTCAPCEPGIIATRTGWAHTPSGVHLIPDEIGQAEADEAQAARAKNRTLGDPHALGRVFAEELAKSQTSAQQPALSLLEQIAAMSEEEKAALRGLLGPAADPAPPVETTPPAKRTRAKATDTPPAE